VDEMADRFRVRDAQARPQPNFFVLVKTRVALRNEMLPAEGLAVERRGDGLATIWKAALIRIRHFVAQ
jgi:hypothetical protein